MLPLLLEQPRNSSERILCEQEKRFAPGPVQDRPFGRSSHLPARGHSYSWLLLSAGLGPAARARRRAAAASALSAATKRRAEDRPAGVARRRWARPRTVARAARFDFRVIVMRRLPRSFVVYRPGGGCEPGGSASRLARWWLLRRPTLCAAPRQRRVMSARTRPRARSRAVVCLSYTRRATLPPSFMVQC